MIWDIRCNASCGLTMGKILDFELQADTLYSDHKKSDMKKTKWEVVENVTLIFQDIITDSLYKGPLFRLQGGLVPKLKRSINNYLIFSLQSPTNCLVFVRMDWVLYVAFLLWALNTTCLLQPFTQTDLLFLLRAALHICRGRGSSSVMLSCFHSRPDGQTKPWLP